MARPILIFRLELGTNVKVLRKILKESVYKYLEPIEAIEVVFELAQYHLKLAQYEQEADDKQKDSGNFINKGYYSFPIPESRKGLAY